MKVEVKKNEFKTYNLIKYIVSFLTLLFCILDVIFLRESIGVYNAVIVIVIIISIEYILLGILDIKMLFIKENFNYNIKMLLVKVVGSIVIITILFFLNINLVTNIIGYVLCGLWILILAAQETIVKHRNDKIEIEKLKLNKKRKITTYKKK